MTAGLRRRGASLTAIAAHLNELGELTRGGRPYIRDAVRKILAREPN